MRGGGYSVKQHCYCFMAKNKTPGRRTDVDKIWINGTDMNVVGPLIRKLRYQKQMTQEQLSAQCQVLGLNLTRGTLAKIEARLRFLKACELFVIAKVLGVSMESFYPADFGARQPGSPPRNAAKRAP